MHVLNNSPSPIKANYTPNELFLLAPKTESSGIIEKDKLFIVSNGEAKDPQSLQKVLKNIDELREMNEKRLKEAYKVTDVRRSKQNELYNSRHKIPRIQFQPLEWVLVSKTGTLAARNKTKPTWIGPYQVTQCLHRNVYEVRDLIGSSKVVHSSRMWPYEPDSFKPDQRLQKLFIHDKGALEVQSFIEVKFSQGQYWLRVRWLGFEPETDSWEPLQTMCEDLPALVIEFLTGKETGTARRALKQAQAYIPRSMQSSVNYAINNLASQDEFHNVPSKSPGWLPIEKQILRQCVMKYGMGRYVPIHAGHYLPGKNTQQICSQVQRILRRQAIAEYHHLHLDIFRVGNQNNRMQGGRFLIRENRLEGKPLMLRKCFNQWKFGLSREEVENVKIIYFRRQDTSESRLEFYDYLKNHSNVENIYPAITNRQQSLLEARKKIENDTIVASEKQGILDWFQGYFGEIAESIDDVDAEPSEWQTGPNEFHMHMTDDTVFRFTGLGQNRYRIQKLCLDGTLDRVKIMETGLSPPYSIQVGADVREPGFFEILQRQLGYFDVLHIDPPWKLSSSHPTRGTAISYECLTNKELLELQFGMLQENGIIILWYINSTRDLAREMLERNGYREIDKITWVKLTSTGKVAKGPGHVIQHSTESCILGIKGKPKNMKHNKINDVIHAERGIQSQKPLEIYEMLEKLVPEGKYIDIFARFHNLRRSWVSVGLELTNSHLSLEEEV